MTILLATFLTISVIVNAMFVWYVIGMLRGYWILVDNLDDLKGIINNYNKHLSNLSEMEMFYGDETIKGLVSHTTEMGKAIEGADFYVPEYFSERLREEEEDFLNYEEENVQEKKSGGDTR